MTKKHKVQVASRDAEAGQQKIDEKIFDPFLERVVENPTTDSDTLTHLLKSCLGSGILSMPFAFQYVGLFYGILGTIFVGFICTHCSYILVKCAHILYVKTRRTQMSFAEVAEAALETGPKPGRKFAKSFGNFIKICLFVTYFGAVSAYTVLISKNFQQVLQNYVDLSNYDDETKVRFISVVLLVPLILYCWIRDLKHLAPFSMVANGLMGVSLGITFYYLVSTIISARAIHSTVSFFETSSLPNFLSITVFAIEAIGVMMPLENKMKTPQNFVGVFGVLNRGMFGVTLLYILVGILGYCAFGANTKDVITLNLPEHDVASQIVKGFIGLAVFFTYALQFYVCMDIVLAAANDILGKHAIFAEYGLRTILVTLSVLLAVAVPKIGPFISLIGAFCFSILGLLIPVLIETVTYWGDGFGKWNWLAIKNIIISIISFVILVAGSNSALKEIADIYAHKNTTVAGNFTMTTESILNTTVII